MLAEQRRHDPYYLTDKRPAARTDENDVDSIPVVKLDLNMPSPSSGGKPAHQKYAVICD